MYQRIIHYAFRPLELSGIDKSHFSSRHSTRWLFFPLFPLELRMFVLVEEGKPEDPEETLGATTRTNNKLNPHILYHNSHYFSSVALFSLGNIIKLILCFAGRKQQFGSQLFACHPSNAFVCLCLLVKQPSTEKIYHMTLLNNWKCSFTTILHKRLLLHARADFKLFFALNKKLEQKYHVSSKQV